MNAKLAELMREPIIAKARDEIAESLLDIEEDAMFALGVTNPTPDLLLDRKSVV